MANDEPGAAPADSAHASNGAAADANGSGFKLQFTSAISKKRGRGGDVSVQPKEEVRRELVTGFEGGRLQSADPAAPIQGGKRVIPRQENTFQIGGPNKHNPNRFLPTPEAAETNGDHFELAAPEQQQEVTYGLVTRARPSEQRNGDAAEPNGQNGTAGLSVASREWELQKYKQDMERLPEEAGLDAYEAMPVDAFGEAMLRGMGWAEGRCVGRNAKGVVKAKEYVPRPAKLGLGATPSEILAKPPKKHIKQGESREPKKDMVYVDAEGHVKHVKDGDAQLVERQRKGAAVGKAMRVVAGTHAGLLCSVLEIEPKVGDRSQRASVRLQPSNERVSVRLKELGETWESAEAAPEAHANGHGAKHKHHKHKEKKEKKAGKDRGGSRDADRPPAQEEPSPGGEQGGAHAAAPAQQDGREAERPWLAPYILVKIVDKRLRGGRLYLKKAEVVDVPQPTSCSLVVAESNESVAGVQQSQVETVVPKEAGRRLLIVAGKLRGQRARLLSRDSGAASVRLQLTADFSVHELGFDDVSEYVGEAGEEE